MSGRILHQETKGCFCEDPGYIFKLGERDREDPLYVAFKRGHVVGKPFSPSGEVFELSCDIISGFHREGFFLAH
jgi:hypothetical protein